LRSIAASLPLPPLGFCGQALSRPFCTRLRISVGDVNDGIIFFAFDVSAGSEWMPPVGSRHIAPPLEVVIERNRVIRRREQHRTGDQVFRRRTGEILGSRLALSDGHIGCSSNEFGELAVRNVCFVHEIAVETRLEDVRAVSRRNSGGSNAQLDS